MRDGLPLSITPLVSRPWGPLEFMRCTAVEEEEWEGKGKGVRLGGRVPLVNMPLK